MSIGNQTYAAFDPTSIVAGDFPRLKRVVTIASGANASGTPLPYGTVLGRVTATDKYIVSVATASDGSQNPACILGAYRGSDASAADAQAPAFFSGEFAGEMLNIDASWTIATIEAKLRQLGAMLAIRSVGAVA